MRDPHGKIASLLSSLPLLSVHINIWSSDEDIGTVVKPSTDHSLWLFLLTAGCMTQKEWARGRISRWCTSAAACEMSCCQKSTIHFQNQSSEFAYITQCRFDCPSPLSHYKLSSFFVSAKILLFPWRWRLWKCHHANSGRGKGCRLQ